jgi:phthalate 4,5-dioxygenase
VADAGERAVLTAAENELLCRTGAQTPMGRMMRRYWIPALLGDELAAGGAPKRVRLLGEDLVAFRDSAGRVGLVDENCPHRGASLALARNEDGALRCLYHGWRIDCTGTVRETPAEPEESSFAARVRTTAYPTSESGGVVWAYLGPPGAEPPPMDFAFTTVGPEYRNIIKVRTECNWAQCLEGVIDSSHTMFLHSTMVRAGKDAPVTVMRDDGSADRPTADRRPRMETQDTAYGYRYAAIRKPTIDPEHMKYVRVTLFIAPIYAMFPPPKGWVWMQAFVPIDDENTMFYFFQMRPGEPIRAEERVRFAAMSGLRPGIDFGADYRKFATRETNWNQDRAAMDRGETFTGFHGVNIEDLVVQESMGRIYDRTKEHLGTSDIAVIRMRRLMLDAVRRFEAEGAPPLGLAEPVDYARLRAEERIVPHEVPWQTVGACAGEATHAGAR